MPGAGPGRPDDGPPMRAPETIRERAGFVAASRAARAGATAFLLQGRDRGDGAPLRVGITASRKVGNAVARNRAKRRLRAAARAVIAAEGRAGWDYVLVGRAGATADHPWDDLLADLSRALARLHAAPAPRPAPRPEPAGAPA